MKVAGALCLFHRSVWCIPPSSFPGTVYLSLVLLPQSQKPSLKEDIRKQRREMTGQAGILAFWAIEWCGVDTGGMDVEEETLLTFLLLVLRWGKMFWSQEFHCLRQPWLREDYAHLNSAFALELSAGATFRAEKGWRTAGNLCSALTPPFQTLPRCLARNPGPTPPILDPISQKAHQGPAVAMECSRPHLQGILFYFFLHLNLFFFKVY